MPLKWKHRVPTTGLPGNSHSSPSYMCECLVAQLCLTLCHMPARILCPWDSSGKNTGVGSHSFLQGIFLTQGSNLGLLHCRQILYCLNHQGRPILLYESESHSVISLYDPMDHRVHGILQARILEWEAFSFSRGSSQIRDQTQVSHIAGGFFTKLSHN